jgi:tetratricopeptide (TPR) repeat protein
MKTILLFALATSLATFVRGATSPALNAPSPAAAPSIAIIIRAADPGSKFLAAEYARTLIHEVAGHEQLAVVPRARVLRAEVSEEDPVEVGRALPVTHVLFAVVHVTGEEFILRGELIEISSSRKLWSEIIGAKLADGAGSVGQVLHAVTGALHLPALQVGEREPRTATANSAAWRAYLRGRCALQTLAEPSLLDAIAHFETALSTDPKFTLARVALATAHIAMGYNFQNPRVHFTKARGYLTQATRLNPPLTEAVTADVVLKFYHERDWEGAAEGAHLVTGSDPSAVETHACLLHCAQALGRHEAAQNEISSAHRAQPGATAIRAELSCGAYYAGKLAEAEDEARAALDLDPENPVFYWSLARSLTQQGKLDSALAALTTAKSKPGGDWTGILAETAYVYARQNRPAEARQVIAQLHEREKTEYVDPYIYAMAYAGLGETDRVCRHLEAAAANDSPWIPSVAIDPKFARLRHEPQYRALVRTLGLSVD